MSNENTNQSGERRLSEGDHDLLVELRTKISHVEAQLGTLVTQLEFAPVRMLVYAGCGLVLSSIVAAVVAMVVRTPK